MNSLPAKAILLAFGGLGPLHRMQAAKMPYSEASRCHMSCAGKRDNIEALMMRTRL